MNTIAIPSSPSVLGSPLRVPVNTPVNQSEKTKSPFAAKLQSAIPVMKSIASPNPGKQKTGKREWDGTVNDLTQYKLSREEIERRKELFAKYSPALNPELQVQNAATQSQTTMVHSSSLETLNGEVDFEYELRQFNKLALGTSNGHVSATSKPTKRISSGSNTSSNGNAAPEIAKKSVNHNVKRTPKVDLTKVEARTDSGLKQKPRTVDATQEKEKKSRTDKLLEELAIGVKHLNTVLDVKDLSSESSNDESKSQLESLITAFTATTLGLIKTLRENKSKMESLEAVNADLMSRLVSTERELRQTKATLSNHASTLESLTKEITTTNEKHSSDINHLFAEHQELLNMFETQNIKSAFESVGGMYASELGGMEGIKRDGLFGRMRSWLHSNPNGDGDDGEFEDVAEYEDEEDA